MLNVRKKKRILIDFDGVIHSYTTPYRHAWYIPDPPVAGCFNWLRIFIVRYPAWEVCVYSSRSRHIFAIWCMRKWFLSHGMPKDALGKLKFPKHKPAAYVTLDDRCICFDGAWDEGLKTKIIRFTSYKGMRDEIYNV